MIIFFWKFHTEKKRYIVKIMETADTNTDIRYAEWVAGAKYLFYRHNARVSQAEVARALDLAPSHLNSILAGSRNAGPVLQDRIAVALGYSHDALRAIGQLELAGESITDGTLELLRSIYCRKNALSLVASASQSNVSVAIAGTNGAATNTGTINHVVNAPPPALPETIRDEIVSYLDRVFAGKAVTWQIGFRQAFAKTFPNFENAGKE